MVLYCLDDKGSWGKSLQSAAKARGIETCLFQSSITTKPNDFLFARVNQGNPRMEVEKRLVRDANCKLIISLKDTAEYEDKLAQTAAYGEFMPRTLLIRDSRAAQNAIDTFSFPFVSKAKTGSASCNVRLITNVEQANNEIKAVFGEGLSVPHRLGEHSQRGYLIWQDFLPGNDYDYRVCKIGRYIMILRRGNRDGVPFASGSGRTEAVEELTPETQAVYDFSENFFSTTGTKWCGIDVVRDYRYARWCLLETTIGWKQTAYANCRFFGTDFVGSQMWDLVANEIELGVFA